MSSADEVIKAALLSRAGSIHVVDCDALVETISVALTIAGIKLLRREPSEEMLKVALVTKEDMYPTKDRNALRKSYWRAMWDAAK